MTIIKCKMCGGDLTLIEGQTVAECEFCGSRQTVPAADDEKKLVQFERAERLRKQCEFDKAAGIYESIVADFRQEAEAYWGLVLCKFGIEYVDDPATGKKIPTCHRSSFDSIMEDNDFEQALENADPVARKAYRAEAKQIEEIRKGIIAVSSNEKPYDIFICYKETDENGDRTLDSVLAQDIYDTVTAKGYRTFFARITLEDKLGMEYEPYIFAALNSAKIMLAVGTDYEYYNAVWVKNEWSRFLKLMAKDKSKHLIPCYKGIDAYDMPKEFARLQAQDLGKMGAIQDILRGVEKLIPRAVPTTVIQEKVVVGGSGMNKIASLLDRGNMALEDGDWAKADSFFEDVLNNDSKNAQAYLGKTLAMEKCRTIDAFARKRKEASQNVRGETLHLEPDYAHVSEMTKRFCLSGYVEQDAIRKLYDFDLSYHSDVAERQQQYRNEESYWVNHKWLSRAEKFAVGAVAENLAAEKKALFTALSDRVKKAEAAEMAAKQDVQIRYEAHLRQADEQAEALYNDGLNRREAHYQKLLQIAKTSANIAELTQAAEQFAAMGDYQDSKNLAEHCRKRTAEEQAKLDAAREAKRIADARAAAARKKKMLITGIIAAVVIIAIIVGVSVVKSIQKRNAYDHAMELYQSGDFDGAIAEFEQLGDYENSVEMIQEVRFAIAVEYFEQGDYDSAEAILNELVGHAQREQMLDQIRQQREQLKQENAYQSAKQLLEEKRFLEAGKAFAEMGDYADSPEMVKESMYQLLQALWELYLRFDLSTSYLEVNYKTQKLFFSIPENVYTGMEGEFEAACEALFADEYDVDHYVDMYAGVEEATYNEKNHFVTGPVWHVIDAGAGMLGDYKDAGQFSDKQYDYAISLKKAEEYDRAIVIFTALGDYKDSAEQIKQCRILPYAKAEAGDRLIFGGYNGQSLYWKVLAREGNSLLMITESCVAERRFQTNQNDPKYYINSPLREFLNENFYYAAFPEAMRDYIEERTLPTTGGNVQDKVFLLSDEEASKYFASDEDRKSADGDVWFLRTVNSVRSHGTGNYYPIAMQVTSKGAIYQNDNTVGYPEGIRPAMWIDVSEYVANVKE